MAGAPVTLNVRGIFNRYHLPGNFENRPDLVSL
jgi:hypothetical protein